MILVYAAVWLAFWSVFIYAVARYGEGRPVNITPPKEDEEGEEETIP